MQANLPTIVGSGLVKSLKDPVINLPFWSRICVCLKAIFTSTLSI